MYQYGTNNINPTYIGLFETKIHSCTKVRVMLQDNNISFTKFWLMVKPPYHNKFTIKCFKCSLLQRAIIKGRVPVSVIAMTTNTKEALITNKL